MKFGFKEVEDKVEVESVQREFNFDLFFNLI